MLRLRTRIVLLTVVCAIAVGAGVQWAYAEVGGNWCRRACAEECRESGGCDVSQAAGCNCYFFCDNGEESEILCGL